MAHSFRTLPVFQRASQSREGGRSRGIPAAGRCLHCGHRSGSPGPGGPKSITSSFALGARPSPTAPAHGAAEGGGPRWGGEPLSALPQACSGRDAEGSVQDAARGGSAPPCPGTAAAAAGTRPGPGTAARASVAAAAAGAAAEGGRAAGGGGSAPRGSPGSARRHERRWRRGLGAQSLRRLLCHLRAGHRDRAGAGRAVG